MRKQKLLTGVMMFVFGSLCGTLVRFLGFDGELLTVRQWLFAGILIGIYVPAQIMILETVQEKPWKDFEAYTKLGALMAWSLYLYAAGAWGTQKLFAWVGGLF